MWPRKDWLFWSRLARYHVLKVIRALDAKGIRLRLLGQAVVWALFLLVGGYLLGRVTAPGCAPLVNAVCTEAQVMSPPAAPMELERQVVIVTAEAVRPSEPVLASSAVHPAAATPGLEIANAIPPLPEGRRTERVVALTNDEVREMQAWLKAFGFDPGPIDGYAGARTKAAIRRYQAAKRAEETGELDRSLLRQVRRDAGHS